MAGVPDLPREHNHAGAFLRFVGVWGLRDFGFTGVGFRGLRFKGLVSSSVFGVWVAGFRVYGGGELLTSFIVRVPSDLAQRFCRRHA